MLFRSRGIASGKGGKVAVDVKFAYPTGGHCDDACDWTKDQLHSTIGLPRRIAHNSE